MTTALKPVDDRDPVTVLGTFWPGKNTIPEILAAAVAIERLGYVPEVRFSGNNNDPESLELVTRDVPAMIGKLRASLVVTSAKEGRRETPKSIRVQSEGATEPSDLEAAMRCYVCTVEATDENKGRRPHDDLWLCNTHSYLADLAEFVERAVAEMSTDGATS